MMKFYLKYKPLIVSLVFLLALISAFIITNNSPLRNFFQGLAAGSALVLLGIGLNKIKLKRR